jgi:site-specific recombinase XerD
MFFDMLQKKNTVEFIPRRTLELKPKQVLLFYKYISKEREDNHKELFLNKLSKPISVDTINRMLRPLNVLIPMKKVNAQTIRQSVISNWINVDNIGIEDVQLLSGQKWLSSIDKYKREDSNQKRELINQFFPR